MYTATCEKAKTTLSWLAVLHGCSRRKGKLSFTIVWRTQVCPFRPVPHVSRYFSSAIFSLRIQKFPRPHELCIQIESVRPQVSDTYPDSLLSLYPGEYWQQSMRRKARQMSILLYPERTWERGCHREFSIHGKELGLNLLSGFSVHTIPDSQRIHYVKNFFGMYLNSDSFQLMREEISTSWNHALKLAATWPDYLKIIQRECLKELHSSNSIRLAVPTENGTFHDSASKTLGRS